MEIKFENVTRKFGEVLALDQISFNIHKGEFVFITGRSGGGKTTILRLILGELLPTEGEVWIDDLCLNKAKEKEILSLRRQIGVVFQDFRLLSDKTVKENILVALSVTSDDKEGVEERLNSTLEVVGLTNRADFFPAQLSGGEIQRVSLARALVIRPKVILADEPTGNLDPETSRDLVNLFKQINKKGISIIMATHNFEIVNSLKQRVVRVENSKIVSDKKKGKYV